MPKFIKAFQRNKERVGGKMKIELSVGERSSTTIALEEYLEKLNSIKNKNNLIKNMIKSTESAIKTFEETEKAEAEKYLNMGEGDNLWKV